MALMVEVANERYPTLPTPTPAAPPAGRARTKEGDIAGVLELHRQKDPHALNRYLNPSFSREDLFKGLRPEESVARAPAVGTDVGPSSKRNSRLEPDVPRKKAGGVKEGDPPASP